MPVTRNPSEWALQLSAINRAVDDRERALLGELAESRTQCERWKVELHELREQHGLLESETSQAALKAIAADSEARLAQRTLEDQLARTTEQVASGKRLLAECEGSRARLEERCGSLEESLRRESARSQDLAQAHEMMVRELATVTSGNTSLLKSLFEQHSVVSQQFAVASEQSRHFRDALARSEQVLASMKAELSAIRTSWLWRLVHLWHPYDRDAAALKSLREMAEITSSLRADPGGSIPQSDGQHMKSTSNSGLEESNMTRSAREPETSVAYLMTLFDVEFVHAAYALLLGRSPDSTGLETFLAKVRAGVSREDILVGIATSEEGRSKRLSVDGLGELTAKSHTKVRRLVRRWFGGSDSPVARQLRAIENRLAATASNVDGRLDRLEASLRRVEAVLSSDRRTNLLAAAGVTPYAVGGNPHTGIVNSRPDSRGRLEQRIFDSFKSQVREQSGHA